MSTATFTPTKIERSKTAPVYEHQFTAAQWTAFRNGALASLMGYTHVQLWDLRQQWAKCNREAWDIGNAFMDNMTGRADVQWALIQRYSEEGEVLS